MNADNIIEFGPVPTLQVNEFENVLAEYNIAYEIVVDEDERAAQLAAHNAANPTGQQPLALNAAFTYFKMSQADLARVTPEFEKLGFAAKSTGEDELSAEDYMCPDCDYHTHDPGLCPKCQTALVDFSTYNEKRRSNKAAADKTGVLVALAIGALIAAYMYFK
jgi:hypothetical protein